MKVHRRGFLGGLLAATASLVCLNLDKLVGKRVKDEQKHQHKGEAMKAEQLIGPRLAQFNAVSCRLREDGSIVTYAARPASDIDYRKLNAELCRTRYAQDSTGRCRKVVPIKVTYGPGDLVTCHSWANEV